MFPQGTSLPLSQPALAAGRGAPRARDGRARRPGLHRRQREGAPPTQVQARAAADPGDRLRSDRGPTGRARRSPQRKRAHARRSSRRSRRRGSPTAHPPTSGTTALPPDPRTTRPSRSVCCFSWRTRRRGRRCRRGRCRRPNAAIRRSRLPPVVGHSALGVARGRRRRRRSRDRDRRDRLERQRRRKQREREGADACRRLHVPRRPADPAAEGQEQLPRRLPDPLEPDRPPVEHLAARPAARTTASGPSGASTGRRSTRVRSSTTRSTARS